MAAVPYAAFNYLVFLGVFLYLVGFVVNVVVPRSIDRGIHAPATEAVIVDVGLVLLFALQHSVMARPGFKRWWTRYVPEPIERSTYMLFSSATFVLMYWQWRSIDLTIWQVNYAPARVALTVLGGVGWAVALASTFMIDHFELFGLRQVLRNLQAKPQAQASFRVVLLYRLVRHPLMLGFLIAFWSTPTMTAGHLLFAVANTVYILIALRFEERDLMADLGERYGRYRRQVPMLLPRPWR
ncbi:methanethiol S-methyltransferase [Mycobacterium sp. ML4]